MTTTSGQLYGFIKRCKGKGIPVVLEHVESYGSIEFYLIPPGETIEANLCFAIFQDRLFRFSGSVESDTEKEVHLIIEKCLRDNRYSISSTE